MKELSKVHSDENSLLGIISVFRISLKNILLNAIKVSYFYIVEKR